MGCPDWPKCFGGYLPPASVSELPEGYEAQFRTKRLKKNERLSGLLQSLGWTKLANRVRNDPQTFATHAYSPWTAWIEYVNRLIGALIGLFMLVYTYFSLAYWNKKRSITLLALAGLVLVIFQGWVGSLVVSTNLLPGFISFHMSLALLLVAFLMHTYYQAMENKPRSDGSLRMVCLGLFILVLPQILLGVNVREVVDGLLDSQVLRADLIDALPAVFYVHRSFSLLVLVLAIYGLSRLRKKGLNSSLIGQLFMVGVYLISLLILGGAGMAYFAMPKFLQPLHLLFSSVLFGVLYFLVLLSRRNVAN